MLSLGSLSAAAGYPIDNKDVRVDGFGWVRPPNRTSVHASLPIPSTGPPAEGLQAVGLFRNLAHVVPLF